MGLHSPVCGVLGVWICSSPLSAPASPSFPQTVPWVHLVPDHILTLSILFDVTSSLRLAVVCSASLWVTFWVIYTDMGVL